MTSMVLIPGTGAWCGSTGGRARRQGARWPAGPANYPGTPEALERCTPGQLTSFAARLDSGLKGEDFADAAPRPGQLPDEAFIGLGVTEADVTALRDRFAAWPG